MGFGPTYSMYPLLTAGNRRRGGSRATRAHDYTVTAADAAAQVAEARPDVVFLCTPNNPTGTPLGLDVIEAVYDATDGIVIVDEAYHEFAPRDERSALTLLPGRERLVVSRTMSKAFAFAGARVGYLAADPAFIDALRLVRLPYHLSVLTQAAATAALRHAPTMLRMVDDIVDQRDRISATLEALGYQPVRVVVELRALRRRRRSRCDLAARCTTEGSSSATSASRTTCASRRAPRPRRRRSSTPSRR